MGWLVPEYVPSVLRRRYREQPRFDVGEVDERRVRELLKPRSRQVQVSTKEAPARVSAAGRQNHDL